MEVANLRSGESNRPVPLKTEFCKGQLLQDCYSKKKEVNIAATGRKFKIKTSARVRRAPNIVCRLPGPQEARCGLRVR